MHACRPTCTAKRGAAVNMARYTQQAVKILNEPVLKTSNAWENLDSEQNIVTKIRGASNDSFLLASPQRKKLQSREITKC